MRWLLTGGCGFIGRTVIDLLLAEDESHSIRVLDNLEASSRDDLATACSFTESDGSQPIGDGAGVELVVGDIRNLADVTRACAGAQTVIHLAANTGVQPSIEDPLRDCAANVQGIINTLEAARAAQVDGFVFSSSGAPLGEQDPPIHEEMVLKPLSPYGASKAAGEAYCSAYHGSFGVPTVALRFGNVYGPLSGRKQSVVARFIRRALEGKPMEIYGDGHQTRDYIYSVDIGRAILAGARAGVGGEVFQIATHRETSVLEIAQALCPLLDELAGITPEVVHCAPLSGEMRRNFSDISKARRVLGWEPQMALDEGLRLTVEWFCR